jgi:hypothetical protein
VTTATTKPLVAPITDDELAKCDELLQKRDAHLYFYTYESVLAIRERLRLAEACIADVEYWKDCVGHYRGCTDAIKAYRQATGSGK